MLTHTSPRTTSHRCRNWYSVDGDFSQTMTLHDGDKVSYLWLSAPAVSFVYRRLSQRRPWSIYKVDQWTLSVVKKHDTHRKIQALE